MHGLILSYYFSVAKLNCICSDLTKTELINCYLIITMYANFCCNSLQFYTNKGWPPPYGKLLARCQTNSFNLLFINLNLFHLTMLNNHKRVIYDGNHICDYKKKSTQTISFQQAIHPCIIFSSVSFYKY